MGFISSHFKKICYKLKPKKNLDNIIIENKKIYYLFNFFGSDKGSLVFNENTMVTAMENFMRNTLINLKMKILICWK